MQIETLISEINSILVDTFVSIDTWFDRDERLRKFKPADNGWSINEILEHIGLTNHFLLILIEKGTRKALHSVDRGNIEAILEDYQFTSEKLSEVGSLNSFKWIRPEHMEPKGNRDLDEVRDQLKQQVNQCLQYLNQLKNGEGVLYKTTMTVNNLGKLDVYQYIYFLAQHGRRHITQMQENEVEFNF